MKITIRKPLAFSEIGRKDNQEDALYPNPATVGIDQKVFIMCDGMGGHEHGEVASQTVSAVLGQVLDSSTNPRADFQIALSAAYDALDAKDTNDGGKKMGTTMTCLILDENGAMIAHIGDSRVYHISPATGLKYQTTDHSLVQDLLRGGVITEEEAKVYPHKNIITRAMQPHQEKRSKAEIYSETNIQSGDYFFLCCDGVLEQLTNERLCEILSMPIPDKDKLALIKAECDGKTKDNYTCWLIPIDTVEGVAEVTPDSEDVIMAVSDEEDTSKSTDKESSSSSTDDEEAETRVIVPETPATPQTPIVSPNPEVSTTASTPQSNKIDITRIASFAAIAIAFIAAVGYLVSSYFSSENGSSEGTEGSEIHSATDEQTERVEGGIEQLLNLQKAEEASEDSVSSVDSLYAKQSSNIIK